MSLSRLHCHNLLYCHLVTIIICLRYMEIHLMFLSVSDVPLDTGLFGGHDYLRGLHVLSLEFLLWNGKETGNIGLLGPDFLLQFRLGPRGRWRTGEL